MVEDDVLQDYRGLKSSNRFFVEGGGGLSQWEWENFNLFGLIHVYIWL